MKYVCNQPVNSRDLYASLVEENSCLVAKEREWEKEWNQSGIMSRLTEQVSLKECYYSSYSY